MMTAAQVAKLSELTGNWTVPLAGKCAEHAMRDDGQIVLARDLVGVIGDFRCLVIAEPTGPNTWRTERLVGNEMLLDPRDFQ